MKLTAERVRELFEYNPEGGWLVRRTTRGSTKAGERAGSDHPNRYRYVKIDGVLYAEHRVIWLYVTGRWPLDQIDHCDGIEGNNKWFNLREATQSQNMGNRRPQTKLKGVTKSQKGSWQAQIAINKRKFHLGYFPTPEEAHAAYCRKAQELFGEFARTE